MTAKKNRANTGPQRVKQNGLSMSFSSLQKANQPLLCLIYCSSLSWKAPESEAVSGGATSRRAERAVKKRHGGELLSNQHFRHLHCDVCHARRSHRSNTRSHHRLGTTRRRPRNRRSHRWPTDHRSERRARHKCRCATWAWNLMWWDAGSSTRNASPSESISYDVMLASVNCGAIVSTWSCSKTQRSAVFSSYEQLPRSCHIRQEHKEKAENAEQPRNLQHRPPPPHQEPPVQKPRQYRSGCMELQYRQCVWETHYRPTGQEQRGLTD